MRKAPKVNLAFIASCLYIFLSLICFGHLVGTATRGSQQEMMQLVSQDQFLFGSLMSSFKQGTTISMSGGF